MVLLKSPQKGGDDAEKGEKLRNQVSPSPEFTELLVLARVVFLESEADSKPVEGTTAQLGGNGDISALCFAVAVFHPCMFEYE